MELDDEPGIARVTPLGLEPLTDAQAMADLNGRVLDMMTSKVSSQGDEVARWQDAYARLFEVNEMHVAKMSVYRLALEDILRDNVGPYRDSMNRVRKIARCTLESI
jgi:hypothetical protein